MATRLRRPSAALLPDYAAALRAGWSANSTEDTSAADLRALAADPAGFVSTLSGTGRGAGSGLLTLRDGTIVPRLPGRTFWIWDDIWDDAFCGSINLRHQPGGEALPAHVSGHIGFSVVPWRRCQGHASRALALLLPIARIVTGRDRFLLTCDADNIGSRRVIEANGGVADGTEPNPHRSDVAKLRYWIDVGHRPRSYAGSA